MKTNAGFTIIEFMVALAVVALLLSIGTPSYRYVTNTNRVAGEVNGLLGDLQMARATAVKQGQFVTVCVSSNGTTCANSTNWQNGWITFTDLNGNSTLDAGEPAPLRVQKTFTSKDTFTASNNVTAVTFNRQGIAIGAANTQIMLQDATANSKWTRCLFVTRVGLTWSQAYGVTQNGFSCP